MSVLLVFVVKLRSEYNKSRIWNSALFCRKSADSKQAQIVYRKDSFQTLMSSPEQVSIASDGSRGASPGPQKAVWKEHDALPQSASTRNCLITNRWDLTWLKQRLTGLGAQWNSFQVRVFAMKVGARLATFSNIRFALEFERTGKVSQVLRIYMMTAGWNFY